jgi:xylan 1,4-beta-xylosidase
MSSTAWLDAVNPVRPGFHPDPTVCRVDGADGTWFYLVTSTFEYLPGLPVHRSRDLVHWELVGHVLDRPEQVDLAPVRDSGGLFAPTLRHDGERFLLVCTVVGGREGASGNFVATATDPAGPWSDPVWWPEGGIDPSILVDGSRLWAHGTRVSPQPAWDQQTEVWVRELDPRTLVPFGEEHVVWSGAVHGAIWAEGPHLYRRGEHYYLLAAEGGTGYHHAISVARAEHPTGPYTGNPANPVLSHRQLGRGAPVQNVGHADLVDHPDGTSWAVCLASRWWDGGDPLGRETFLVDVQWQDDWPVLAPLVGQLSPEPALPVATGVHTPLPEPVRDLLGVRRHPVELGLRHLDGERFRLTAGTGLRSDRPAYVARRLTRLEGGARVRVEEADDGVRAGLALRYSGTAHLEATIDGDRVVVEVVSPGQPPVRLDAAVPAGPRVIEAVLHGSSATLVVTPDDGETVRIGPVDVGGLCTSADGGFVGLTYGAVAIAPDGTDGMNGTAGAAVFSGLEELPPPSRDDLEETRR